MKHILIAASVVFAAVQIHTPSFAQTGSGIYLTEEDFINKKTSYQQEDAGQQHKVNADVLFRQGLVKVKQGDKVHNFKKGKIFGFRDKYNQDFRFLDNKKYKVVDDAHFYLYSTRVEVTKGKERTKETKYYFSTAAGSELIPLTKSNLKKAFPDNRNFHDLLDMQFRSDRDLVMYDSYHKEYKVKSIFNKASTRGSLQAFNK